MIIVDTSALVAIYVREPGFERLVRAIAEDREALLSAATYVEAAAVFAGRAGAPDAGWAELDLLLGALQITVVALDPVQAREAARGRIRFGKGFGGPLNFGDSFAYALAKSKSAPLLFVGDDFSRTDVTPALT